MPAKLYRDLAGGVETLAALVATWYKWTARGENDCPYDSFRRPKRLVFFHVHNYLVDPSSSHMLV